MATLIILLAISSGSSFLRLFVPQWIIKPSGYSVKVGTTYDSISPTDAPEKVFTTV